MPAFLPVTALGLGRLINLSHGRQLSVQYHESHAVCLVHHVWYPVGRSYTRRRKGWMAMGDLRLPE